MKKQSIIQDIQKWVSELEAAGWKKWRGNGTVWESPWGTLYRGPFRAWEVMKSGKRPDFGTVWELPG